MCVCRVGVDRVSGLGSMLYGTTLRGHVPSDLAFRSHLGSSLELSCLPELGAVFFAMSGDQQRGVPLQQYVEQKYGEDWFQIQRRSASSRARWPWKRPQKTI